MAAQTILQIRRLTNIIAVNNGAVEYVYVPSCKGELKKKGTTPSGAAPF